MYSVLVACTASEKNCMLHLFKLYFWFFQLNIPIVNCICVSNHFKTFFFRSILILSSVLFVRYNVWLTIIFRTLNAWIVCMWDWMIDIFSPVLYKKQWIHTWISTIFTQKCQYNYTIISFSKNCLIHIFMQSIQIFFKPREYEIKTLMITQTSTLKTTLMWN